MLTTAIARQDGVRIWAYAPPSEPRGLTSHAWELAYCWVRSAALSMRVAFGVRLRRASRLQST